MLPNHLAPKRLYPGPTLVAQRGDRVRLLAVNQINLPANLHFHGFHVTPTVRTGHQGVEWSGGRKINAIAH